MKLRNKKTGEIAEFVVHKRVEDSEDGCQVYEPFVIKPEEWEDYEEPKEYWYIGSDGELFCEPSDDRCEFDNNCREIGNYFETKEEAEKAVEKLKAWKRLKDLGFKCSYHSSGYHRGTFTADFIFDEDKLPIMDTFVAKDLNLLFGGEE